MLVRGRSSGRGKAHLWLFVSAAPNTSVLLRLRSKAIKQARTSLGLYTTPCCGVFAVFRALAFSASVSRALAWLQRFKPENQSVAIAVASIRCLNAALKHTCSNCTDPASRSP